MDQFTQNTNLQVDLIKSKYSIKIKKIGGNHKRTIIYGWYDNKEELKEPFKELKKGCGGSIKKLEIPDFDEKVWGIVIQKHFDTEFIKNFFIKYGIEEKDIEFK